MNSDAMEVLTPPPRRHVAAVARTPVAFPQSSMRQVSCQPEASPERMTKQVELHISGLSGLLCSVVAAPNWTVRQLKVAVEAATAIPMYEQQLLVGATELSDDDLLEPSLHRDEGGKNVSLVRRPQAEAAFLRRRAEVRRAERLVSGFEETLREDREVVPVARSSARARLPCTPKAVPATWSSLSGPVPAARSSDGQDEAPRPVSRWSAELLADWDFMLEQVRSSPRSFAYAADALKTNRDFVLACMQCGEDQVESLLSSPRQALRHARSIFELAPHEIRRDAEIRNAAGLGSSSSRGGTRSRSRSRRRVEG
mmetsp:Transcript_101861/g.287376  ORF Transcript_101861/g.287376 Transcript_101861/m.287376 type:complete len:312 (-) Transcript_101861:256-1191(-)